ncbi:hypothetical protein SISNIDRAFT_548890 [Sistotremastrum niveocremeum HHB9708]|uniref:Uncharacterized protein n=1 Tax=Sistotremastrum niveocremeum HHB9708 TaxID=1314777 RepID=A0A164WFK0_9AGAM|nr:hypothetical protein SISNIDRAFT_548890 [Sistotremastrum niveocremeum HHB9708]
MRSGLTQLSALALVLLLRSQILHTSPSSPTSSISEQSGVHPLHPNQSRAAASFVNPKIYSARPTDSTLLLPLARPQPSMPEISHNTHSHPAVLHAPSSSTPHVLTVPCSREPPKRILNATDRRAPIAFFSTFVD